MKNNIKTARNIFETAMNATDCTIEDYELYEIKEVMQTIIDWLEDDADKSEFGNTLEIENLVCGEVRVINAQYSEEILQDYFTNYYDEYLLGGFNSSILARISDLPEELLEIIHESGDKAWSSLGKYLSSQESAMSALAVEMDNREERGCTFSGHDSVEHETKYGNFYVYRTN